MWNYIYADELCHYGIKGMKWGVRRYQNPDGTLTDAGKRRYAESWKQNYMNSGASENPAVTFTKAGLSGDKFEQIRSSIKSCAKEMEDCAKEAQKLLGEYESDLDVHYKYKAIAGIVNPLVGDYGDSNMGYISNSMWFYAYEDGDQGWLNSASIYVHTKGLQEKGADIVRRDMAAQKRYQDECEKLVSDYLGVYGDQKVGKTSWSDSVNKSIAWHMKNYDEDRIWDKTDGAAYVLREACDGWSVKDAERVNGVIKKANNIVDKLDLSGNKLNYMWQAVENLGYDNVDMDDMTDAQWAALNREMSRLDSRAK